MQYICTRSTLVRQRAGARARDRELADAHACVLSSRTGVVMCVWPGLGLQIDSCWLASLQPAACSCAERREDYPPAAATSACRFTRSCSAWTIARSSAFVHAIVAAAASICLRRSSSIESGVSHSGTWSRTQGSWSSSDCTTGWGSRRSHASLKRCTQKGCIGRHVIRCGR
jgi:hypothetical protein